MKIIVISNYYPPHFKGGYELSCQQVVGELQRRGNELLVVTSNWHFDKDTGQRNVKRILHVTNFGRIKGIRRRIAQVRRIASGLQDYASIKRLSMAYQPEVAYIWSMSGLSLLPITALQQWRIPLVFDLGDYWLLERLADLSIEKNKYKKIYRTIIHGKADIQPSSLKNLLTHSQVMKQRHVDLGFAAESITVIPRGMPEETIADEPCHNNGTQEMRMLYAGRLSEEKGVHLAVEALAQLVHQENLPSVQLDIIGTGNAEYTHYLQQIAATLKVQNHVHFLGQVPHENVVKSYQQYAILLFPSIWVEPFGRSVIEAMAQGVCVIASKRGGPVEIITHGQDGFLVPPENSQALAEIAASLLRDTNWRNQIGQAAIHTVRQRYRLDLIGDRIETYLCRVIEDSRRA